MGLRDKLDEALEGDEIDLDLSAAREEMDFSQPVECKQYEFEIIEATPGTSGNKNPKVVFRLKIVDEGPFKGRTLFKHAPVKGEGADIFRDVWKAAGLDIDAKPLRASSAIGKHLLATVRMQKGSEEYQELFAFKPVKAAGTAGKPKRLG